MKRTTLLATGIAVGALLLAASQAGAGYYYESITTDQIEGKRDASQMTVKAWVEGDKSRVEFVSGEKKGLFAAGNYLVTTDGAETVYLVNPKDETYGTISMEAMLATMGQVMNMMEQMGGVVQMEFSNVGSEKLLEEPGESILGHPTTRYRFKSQYTLTMKIVGMKQEHTTETVQDIWSTDHFDARGFGVWLRPDRRMQTGNQELDKLIDQEMAKIKGMPLKMVNETTTTNKKGRSQKSTSTMEVTVLREESIPAATFEWPSHYREIQILPDLAEIEGLQQQGGSGKTKKKN